MVQTLASWVHDLDPVVLRIPGGLAIRWYGLSYVAGFLFGWIALSALAKRGRILIPAQRVPDLILALVAGTLIGGRLGYAIIYQPSLFISTVDGPPWWALLAINEGGMASHGGMAGVVIAGWIFARALKIPALHVADCAAFAAPVGIFLARCANFVNGELLGRMVAGPGEPAPGWAVKYPQEMVDRWAPLMVDPAFVPPELTQDQATELRAFLTSVSTDPGATDLMPVAYDVINEIQQGNAALAQAIEPYLSARHPSQLYQAFAEGLLVLAVLVCVWRRPRKPGVVGAWFLIVYGIGRVLTEFVRLPDAHLAAQRLVGLSRGQWLSIAMVGVGAFTLWWVSKRSNQDAIGGWAGPAPEPEAPSEG